MERPNSYPVSPTGVAIGIKLIVAYVVLVANATLFYLLATDDLPLNYFLLMTAAGVSAWALHKRWEWGLFLVVAFFGWQLYVGIGGASMYFNAAVKNTSAEAVTLIVLSMGRTILILVLFSVLAFHALRKGKTHSA